MLVRFVRRFVLLGRLELKVFIFGGFAQFDQSAGSRAYAAFDAGDCGDRLACGLDPEKVWLYRQSDVPEITELMWLLTCVRPGRGFLIVRMLIRRWWIRIVVMGMMMTQGSLAGLFMYPVLMAADILLFNAHQVPVGRDQIQHIEMARDFAQRFNHIYGGEYLVLPEAAIDEQVATLPGLDGRKMSKSYWQYDAAVLYAGGVKEVRVFDCHRFACAREPKEAVGSAVFQLYQAFAGVEECSMFAQALVEGLGWGRQRCVCSSVLMRRLRRCGSVMRIS